MRSNVITGAQVYNNLLSNPFRVDQLRLPVNRPPTPPLSHNFALSEKKVLMLIGGGGGGGGWSFTTSINIIIDPLSEISFRKNPRK